MTAADTVRKPWTPADKRRLIAYWESLGSIFLIALLLDRPEGSVQTEASRRCLPRRDEGLGRHRKKWTQEELDGLRNAVAELRTADGRIRIIDVANRVGRSVDAVASRLAEDFQDRNDLRKAIYVPEETLKAVPAPAAVPDPGIDQRKVAKIRDCITCENPFWSEGAHNRICKRCRETDDSDWDFCNS